MTTRSITVFALLAIVASGQTSAGDNSVSDDAIKQLVAGLASPNKAPKVIGEGGEGPEAVFPRRFDPEAQQQVVSTRESLNRLGIRAFPFLFDHLDDPAYCMTVDGGLADTNHSVGEACRGIIRCHLEPYNNFGYTKGNAKQDPRTRPLRPCYTDHFLRDAKAAKEWWETHKQKSLLSLQVEAVEWIVAEEARSERPYASAEKDYLRKLLADLRKTKRPLTPTVPWAK